MRQLGTFSTFALRCFFGELGDKTFFLTVILTAWVATWVPRGRPQRQHQFMVFAGALMGLLLHVILVTFDLISARGSALFNFLSVALLVGIGIKLHFQVQSRRKAQEYISDEGATKTEEDAQAWNTTGGAPTASTWNTYATRAAEVQAGITSAEEPQWQHASASPPAQDYGSMHEPDKDLIKEHLQEEGSALAKCNSLVIAGVISMAVIFVVEVAERSQYSFLSSGQEKGIMLIFSAMLGFLVATIVAVFFGYFMESMMKDEWLLFTSEMALFAMALVCFSQAMLGLSTLSMREAATALLAFTSK